MRLKAIGVDFHVQQRLSERELSLLFRYPFTDNHFDFSVA